jgi:hypothetical protein
VSRLQQLGPRDKNRRPRKNVTWPQNQNVTDTICLANALGKWAAPRQRSCKDSLEYHSVISDQMGRSGWAMIEARIVSILFSHIRLDQIEAFVQPSPQRCARN